MMVVQNETWQAPILVLFARLQVGSILWFLFWGAKNGNRSKRMSFNDFEKLICLGKVRSIRVQPFVIMQFSSDPRTPNSRPQTPQIVDVCQDVPGNFVCFIAFVTKLRASIDAQLGA